jgi:aldehyde dehydrogenase (NAD+)
LQRGERYGQEKQFYISGQWVDSSTSETLEVVNPASEDAVASIALGGQADVNKAVAAAKEAFQLY